MKEVAYYRNNGGKRGAPGNRKYVFGQRAGFWLEQVFCGLL